MRPERYEQIYDMVTKALELEPNRREAYLDERCGGNAALRTEAGEQLACTIEAVPLGFMESSPAAFRWEEAVDQNIGIGHRLSDYLIEEFVGHGGQGDVYLATDTREYQKQVAIKILRSGLYTEEAMRRFQEELRIYEELGDHENIARIYSVNRTPDNRPYVVMEFIRGKRIDDYCDEKRLTLRARVNLFLKVLAALKHAHGRLVIHRDIKPQNILVTADDTPKLLDFGIAKLLEEKMAAAGEDSWTVHPPLTPEWASPEQLRGFDKLTTHTDIYSLGLVLYKLLTGHRPFDFDRENLKGLPKVEAIRKMVWEQLPIPPYKAVSRSSAIKSDDGQSSVITVPTVAFLRQTSERQLRRELSGDLATVVLHALRREPEKRYQSVGEFIADLKNWSDIQPLKYAERPTRTDVFLYWIRRNRAASVALVMATILLPLGTLLWTERATRLAETLDNAQYDAVLVASILEDRLEELKLVVDRAGGTPELRGYLVANDRESLQNYVLQVADNSLKIWGENSPIESWAIYDPIGIMIAHSLTPQFVDDDFGFRDYFKGALAEQWTSEKTPGYVSRLYFSRTQDIFKFSISRSIRVGDGKTIGIITTSLTTSRTMGLPKIQDSRFKVVLVGRRDSEVDPEREEPLTDAEYLIVLHPGYPEVQERLRGVSPAVPIPFPSDQGDKLRGSKIEHYEDPAAARYPEYGGSWIAASAPVQGTEFIVIVQVRGP